jgi:predicted RNase H-like HicB family nuclease/DNA-binding XRE family transcriptional regulator
MCIKLKGKILKKGSYWAVFVSALDVYTQGKTKKDAYEMIQDAVEILMNKKDVLVDVDPIDKNTFILKSKKSEHDRYLMALILKNQRAKQGLSLQEVANRLQVSKHAYAQYEQGRAIPSITKLEQFIHAMNHQEHVVINILDQSHLAA